MVRQRLSEKLTPDDVTLKAVIKDCVAVDLLYYAGNISSVLLAPIVYTKLKENNSSFDIYEHNIFLFHMDDVLKLEDRIYVAVSLRDASVVPKAVGKTIFQIFLSISERYYYDNENIIFVIKVSDKYKDDYKRIIDSRYSAVSSYFKDLCGRDELAAAVFNNNSTVYKQWVTYENLIGYVKRNKYSEAAPVKLVDKDRNFPEFSKEQETYFAITK